MARPVVSQAAEDLYAILRPLAYADEQYNWPLLKYCEGNAGLLQEIKDYTDLNGTPPWSGVVDIDRSPYKALPWLGQMVGVTIPNRLQDETQQQHEDRIREYIRSTPGFRRGSPAAMTAAAQQYLTGTKTVYFHERDTSPYHLAINTRKLETPVEDWSSTNILTNGGFESNTTGWSTTNSTITRDTSLSPKFGLASALVKPSAIGDWEAFASGTISGATAGRVFTVSIYVKSKSAALGRAFQIICQESGGAGGSLSNSATIIMTAEYQRISITRTVVNNDRTTITLLARGLNSFGAGEQFSIDGAQIEEQPRATPYIETDGSIQSRIAGNGPVGAALRAQKPAGIVMVYDTITGQDWQHVVDTFATWTAVGAAYATIDLLESG